MPSLKDLAKECGVSVATVSKALNDQPDISAATRERMHAAARRMGYLPNAAARAVKTNRTYNRGVLFVDERAERPDPRIFFCRAGQLQGGSRKARL